MRPGENGEVVLDSRREILALRSGVPLNDQTEAMAQLSYDINNGLYTFDPGQLWVPQSIDSGFGEGFLAPPVGPLQKVENPELRIGHEALPAALIACERVISRRGLIGWYDGLRKYKQTAAEIQSAILAVQESL